MRRETKLFLVNTNQDSQLLDFINATGGFKQALSLNVVTTDLVLFWGLFWVNDIRMLLAG